MCEARLTHIDLVEFSPLKLLFEIQLSDMLSCAQGGREVIEVLKAMLVSLVNSKAWSFCLEVEVDEAF